MRIFSRRQTTDIPDMTLVQPRERHKYDFFSALAKALLIFLLAYGALGGFLSALDIEYSSGLCMLALFIIALLLSAVYETEKRWLENLASSACFLLYLYLAVSRYRLINNGFFAIVNRVYEISRQYLGVTDGFVYSLNADETYTTVTMFALFWGMVSIILLNIMMQTKCSLFKAVLLTLPPYAVLFYFDRSPNLIYVLFLLMGYFTAAILQSAGVRENLSKQIRYTLPLTAVAAILIVRTVSLVLPERIYRYAVPKNTVKEASEEDMVRFAQYGIMALFRRSGASAGVSGGLLSKDAAVMPTYETVLKVRYTPYDYQNVYLKAFTGKEYTGDRWTPAELRLSEDGAMEMSMSIRRDSYAESRENGGDILQGRGVMEVERMKADDAYDYRPYYTDSAETEKHGSVSVYVYYPAVSGTDIPASEPDDAFLEVPLSCRTAVAGICREAGFSGTEEEIAGQIVSFFRDNYSYTMRPGFYIGDPDYITHFLTENKRGYCTHFASAATMLFREMGIPARYVEGYAFSYSDVLEGAVLVEGADYHDYYDGYAPLGETAFVELEIPDSYAHAWVEIYVKEKGWIAVDPTPAQTSQEERSSFWDSFMNGGNDDTDLNIPTGNWNAYLEGALGSTGYILAGIAAFFLIGLGAAGLRRTLKERRLPARERVKLEYGRILSYLAKHHPNYQRLRTLQEQIEWIRRHSRREITDEQADALYQIYFAENVSCDCDALFRQLRKIRKELV